MNWEEYRIGEIVEVSGGGTPDTDNSDYWDGDVLWLTPTEISNAKSRFIDNTKRKITDVGLKNSSARLVPVGSILLTSRATIGDVAINTKPMATNQGFINIICNDEFVETKFLFYWLKVYKDLILAYANGATFLEISKSEFKKIKLNLPPLPVQRRIAQVLGRYDALIENYAAQIRRLEASAQNLYAEWFMRGRCPFAEYETGAKLPVGWEKRELSTFGKVVTGKTPSTSIAEYFGGDIPFIKTPDMHGEKFIVETEENLSKQGAKSQASMTLPENSICVTCIGTAGIVGITTKPKSQTNQQINSIILDDLQHREFLFYAISNLKKTIELFGGTGATMTNLSKGKFEQLQIIYPTENVLLEFHKSARPIFEKIKNLQLQTTKLRQMRDKLLPRLLSGKLPVKVSESENFARR